MTQVSITAVPRDDFGKGAARRLRRAGLVPAVIYGSDTELQHVSLPAHELDLALRKPKVVLEVDLGGSSTLVKPRDVQREPVKRYLEHIDLVVVSKAEAAQRSASANAIVHAEEAAVEAGVDKVAVAIAVQEFIAGAAAPAEEAGEAGETADEAPAVDDAAESSEE